MPNSFIFLNFVIYFAKNSAILPQANPSPYGLTACDIRWYADPSPYGFTAYSSDSGRHHHRRSRQLSEQPSSSYILYVGEGAQHRAKYLF